MASTTPAEWCQAFFVVSTAILVSMVLLPDAACKALLAYGARRPAHTQHGPNSQAPGHKAEAKANSLLVLTSYAQVPHSWFIHFYMASVSWSIFWGWQYISKGTIMRAMAEMQHQSAVENQASEVELSATLVTWLLMSSQGARRLCECLFVAKPGSSPMSAFHWALGVAYYTAVGISVWIQGSGLSRVLGTFRGWLISALGTRLTTVIHRSHPQIVGVATADSFYAANYHRGRNLWLRKYSAKQLPQVSGESQEIYASK